MLVMGLIFLGLTIRNRIRRRKQTIIG